MSTIDFGSAVTNSTPARHRRTPVTGTDARGRLHRPLLGMVGLMAALVVVASVGMVADDRMVLGESVWLKPWKFGFAFALYGLTLAWLLSLPHRGRRATWWLGSVFAVTGVIDVGFIALQAARGSFSHFNNADPDPVNVVGQIIFTSGVPGLFFADLVIAVILSWQRLVDRPTRRAIRAGLLLAVLGMAQAYLMAFSGPQRVHDAYGRPVELQAGHTVLPSDAPADAARDVGGMPLTHWSTIGGDLRVPHFVGLHGIQILLLATVGLAWLSTRVRWLRAERTRAELIGVLALGYGGLFALVFWQAMRAQSLIHPDATTLGVLAGLLVTVAGLATLAVLRGRELVRRDPAALSAAARPLG